jgi:hypothetical protein
LKLFGAAGLFEPDRVGIASQKPYVPPSKDARYRCLAFVKFCEAVRLRRKGNFRNFGCIALQSGNAS